MMSMYVNVCGVIGSEWFLDNVGNEARADRLGDPAPRRRVRMSSQGGALFAAILLCAAPLYAQLYQVEGAGRCSVIASLT